MKKKEKDACVWDEGQVRFHFRFAVQVPCFSFFFLLLYLVGFVWFWLGRGLALDCGSVGVQAMPCPFHQRDPADVLMRSPIDGYGRQVMHIDDDGLCESYG